MNIEKTNSLQLLKSRMSATNLRPSISAWTCQLAIRSVPGQSKRCLIWSFSCNLPAQQSVINRNLKHSAKQLGKPLPFFFDSPLRISCELQQTCRQNMHTLQMHSFAQHTWTFEVSCLPRSHHLMFASFILENEEPSNLQSCLGQNKNALHTIHFKNKTSSLSLSTMTGTGWYWALEWLGAEPSSQLVVSEATKAWACG